MKVISKLVVFFLVLLLEFVVFEFSCEFFLNTGHGPMDSTYRHKERLAALLACEQHPGPVTEAALAVEINLVDQHEALKGEIPLGLLLIANGIGFYFYFRRVPK